MRITEQDVKSINKVFEMNITLKEILKQAKKYGWTAQRVLQVAVEECVDDNKDLDRTMFNVHAEYEFMDYEIDKRCEEIEEIFDCADSKDVKAINEMCGLNLTKEQVETTAKKFNVPFELVLGVVANCHEDKNLDMVVENYLHCTAHGKTFERDTEDIMAE